MQLEHVYFSFYIIGCVFYLTFEKPGPQAAKWARGKYLHMTLTVGLSQRAVSVSGVCPAHCQSVSTTLSMKTYSCQLSK